MKKVMVGFICSIIMATVGLWAIKTTAEEDPFANFFVVLTQPDLPNRADAQRSASNRLHEIIDFHENVDWTNSPKGDVFNFSDGTALQVVCSQKPLADALAEASQYEQSKTRDTEVQNPRFWLPDEVKRAAQRQAPDLQNDIRNCYIRLNPADDEFSTDPYRLCRDAIESVFGNVERVDLTKGMTEAGDGTPIPRIITHGLAAYASISHENGVLLGAHCDQRHLAGAWVSFTAWFLPKQP